MRRTKRKVVIIHFQPLERFPPVLNLLNYFGDNNELDLTVISTLNNEEKSLKSFTHPNIRIIRTPGIRPGSLFRLINYCRFYLGSLWFLLNIKPHIVLYYETLSSWPVLIYKKVRKKKLKVFLHCHEYTSPENYNDMWLVKQMHKMETRMYPSFSWISHTNEVRLEKFKEDHFLNKMDKSVFHLMPNYPPRKWSLFQTEFGSGSKTRLVFAGSLGYDNMYLKEIVDWVILNKEFVSVDFYSYNVDDKARNYFDSLETDCIQFYGGCDYNDLPGILQNYDVGLVLYKPYNFNHINGISNKVYEYLACGLDVWFPTDNTYMLSILRKKEWPKILALDFSHLNDFDLIKAVNRQRLNEAENLNFAENVYSEIYNECL